MSFYSDRVLPHIINLACSTRPTQKQRQKVVPLAAGDVLEIGFGSGLNLPFYNRRNVRRILALEPSEGMRRKAQPLVSASEIDIEFIDRPGEAIALDDASIDTVLVTYTLCTIADTHAVLEGMRRVLKPGGQLIFCEHGAAPDNHVREWQDRLNAPWSKVAGGCNMNRDIPRLLEQGGFELTSDERMYIPGPRILNYNFWGTARPR